MSTEVNAEEIPASVVENTQVSEDESRESTSQYGRLLIVLLIAIVGLCLTLYSLYVVYQADSEKNTEERIRAVTLMADVSSSFNTDISSFNYLASYVSAASDSAIERFSEFAINFLDENNTFQILMYAPRVTPNTLTEYLSEVNPLGYSKQIAQFREDGVYEEALVFDQSFPIDLIENFSRDEIPFGIDLISNQDWVSSLYAARDSSQPIAIHVEFKGKSYYWLVRALYVDDDPISGGLSGYLVASMDPEVGLQDILEDQDIEGYVVQIEDDALDALPANHILNGLVEGAENDEIFEYGQNNIAFGGKSFNAVVQGTKLTEYRWTIEYTLIAILGTVITLILCFTFWNITTRAEKFKGFYTELKESQDQLVQNEKMASLGQMVAGVAHEINTPLGYVNNNVDMIREHMLDVKAMFNKIEWFYKESLLTQGEVFTKLKELVQTYRSEEYEERQVEAMELLEDTSSGITDISKMVLSLKDFSRLDRQQQEKFDLHSGIESTLKIANSVIMDAGITINRYFGDIPPVLCSPSKINQVFLNIITNACQAMQEDGVLDITTSSKPGWAVMSFKDTGTGMSQETKKKVFDPFYTTKDVGQGTGLGMSVSFKIIKEHKGRIEVESELGKGTTISVLLPV